MAWWYGPAVRARLSIDWSEGERSCEQRERCRAKDFAKHGYLLIPISAA